MAICMRNGLTLIQIYRSELQLYSSLKKRISITQLKWASSYKGGGTHKPNTLEKYLLVWMKKYPSVTDVPKTVTYDMMEKVRNWARIKINIFLCFVTIAICVGMVYSGKKAAERGETLQKMNIKWHEEQNIKKEVSK